MKQIFILSAMVIIFSSCSSYYYVVRHADRLNNTDNSPLSNLGFERARILRDSLSTKGIDSIFASTFTRTQQTAQPLATALGLSATIYNKDTTAGFIKRLKKIKNKEVLIAGHSDNVPDIVLGLSGQAVAPIEFNDFDNLYIIKIRKCFTTRRWLWQKTYGRPSP